jgi:hypothetical protein
MGLAKSKQGEDDEAFGTLYGKFTEHRNVVGTLTTTMVTGVGLTLFVAVSWVAAAGGVAISMNLLLALSGIVAILDIALAFFYLESLRLRGQRLYWYEKGFVLAQKQGKYPVRWDDVDSLTYRAIKMMGNPDESATVRMAFRCGASKPIVVTEFEDAATFIEAAFTQTMARLLPRLSSRIEAGETVTFGKIAMSLDGLEYRSELVPWKKIGKVRLDNGCVFINRKGGREWVYFETEQLPNHHVFLALCKYYRQKAKEKPRGPVESDRTTDEDE